MQTQLVKVVLVWVVSQNSKSILYLKSIWKDIISKSNDIRLNSLNFLQADKL